MFAACHDLPTCLSACAKEPSYSRECECECQGEWDYTQSLGQSVSPEDQHCLSETTSAEIVSDVLLGPCVAASGPIEPDSPLVARALAVMEAVLEPPLALMLRASLVGAASRMAASVASSSAESSIPETCGRNGA